MKRFSRDWWAWYQPFIFGIYKKVDEWLVRRRHNKELRNLK